MDVRRSFGEGSKHESLGGAKSTKPGLNWTLTACHCSTIQLVDVACLPRVLAWDLGRSLQNRITASTGIGVRTGSEV